MNQINSQDTQQGHSALIKKMQLPSNFYEIVREIYQPLSQIILESKKSRPLLVSINGAQGSGKSTMTTFLKHIFESELECRVANLSLDDFYCTREERNILAQNVHPLFATRGVPGTHDVTLLEHVLDQLIGQQPCRSPRFNKAIDDRCEETEWADYSDPVEIILFEGWCNNSPVQSRQALSEPVNELERNEDPQGVWRHYANEQLIDYQRRLFERADMCIMLKAPDFECVHEWRGLQEKKLKTSSVHQEQNFVMNEHELSRFIQHFERISRHTLSHLPETADIVLPVAADHSITGIVRNSD